MPSYGSSFCDFCGVEVGAGHIDYIDDENDINLDCEESDSFKWLSSMLILTKNGEIIKAVDNDFSYTLMDNKFNCYTNIPNHSSKHNELAVFLHQLCLDYLVEQIGWDNKKLFQMLSQNRQPQIVQDNQRCLLHVMREEGVELWRANDPHSDLKNTNFFRERYQNLTKNFIH